MSKKSNPAERLTEIVALLRPSRTPKLPESLTAAAVSGDIERLQLFNDRGANIDERSMGHGSPLGAACAFGQLEAIRWLIDHDATLDPPGALISPIQSALGKANCRAAALLLDAGLPVERAAWGVVAAATLDRADVIRWLISRGIDLDGSYPGLGVLRERALRTAKKDGEASRLLTGKADLFPPPDNPPEPLQPANFQPRAAEEDRPALLSEALQLIAAAGKPVARWNATGQFAPPQRQLLMSFAAANGLAEIVSALLGAGGSPNFAPDGTPPPLTAAAAEAQLEVVRLLLERGAAPDGADGKSWLPLASAASSGEPEVVRALLAAGANPKAKPFGGPKLVEYARGPFAKEIREIIEEAASARRGSKRTG